MDPDSSKTKYLVVASNLDAATDQILRAAKTGDPTQVRSSLIYWFELLYDAGMERIGQVEQENELLHEALDHIKKKSSDSWQSVRGVDPDTSMPPHPPRKT